MQLLRSLLFVPGNRERMLEKAAASGADAIVIDLEDAVPAAEKKAARRSAKGAIGALSRDGTPVFVRVNDVRSGLTRDDVMAVVRKGLTGVVLPKTEHPQDLRDLDVLLREAEMANKVRPGDVATIPLIEDPLALMRCEQIALASDRVVALSLGGEDYTATLGAVRSGDALAHPRQVIVTVAAAYGLLSIDTPYPELNNARGLTAEASLARAVGFTGKYVIHPGQVAAVNRAFSPSRAEVAAAKRTITGAGADAGDAAKRGTGAVSVDGRMVDAPIIERARRLVELAEAITRRSKRT